MENLKEAVTNLMQNQLFHSVVIILVSFFIYRVIHKIIMNGEKNSKINETISKRSKTYFKMIINILRYVFIVITILIVLQTNGVDVSSMLAGVGIASVIIGLAVQDALKDIIRGMNIISDNYFSIGDYVKFGEIEGKVVEIGLRTTKISDIKSGTIVSIANRNIEQAGVYGDWIYITIPMPYEVSIEKAEETIGEIMQELEAQEEISECSYKGVSSLDDSCIQYLLGIHSKAEVRYQVKRDSLRIVLLVMARHQIEVPYQQIDIHQK